jgi:uncharacterized protein YecE (DUF72 family)
MFTVGCAGFAVPATRYFKEYLFVEIQETHLAIPGQGTVRRWAREAPPGFEFALLGPRECAQEGFKLGAAVETALAGLASVRDQLNATTAVFTAAPEFGNTRTNKSNLKEFLKAVLPQYKRVVFEVPGWKPDDADALAEELGCLAARDPLLNGLSKRPEAYYRLPGPAGRKSRYEDPAIEELAIIADQGRDQKAHYVFANVDMFSDAKRFRRAIGE